MDKIEKIRQEYIGRWIGIKGEKIVAVSEKHRDGAAFSVIPPEIDDTEDTTTRCPKE